jgi:hypothetical protein
MVMMLAFLPRLLHQNMQHVSPLHPLQVALVCRVYWTSETKHRTLATLAKTSIALVPYRLLCLRMKDFLPQYPYPHRLHHHPRFPPTTQPTFCLKTLATAQRSRPLLYLERRSRSHDRRVSHTAAPSDEWAALSQLRRARDGLPLLALGVAT